MTILAHSSATPIEPAEHREGIPRLKNGDRLSVGNIIDAKSADSDQLI
jgi:hypothetical protein